MKEFIDQLFIAAIWEALHKRRIGASGIYFEQAFLVLSTR